MEHEQPNLEVNSGSRSAQFKLSFDQQNGPRIPSGRQL
jgi:hypothetical protein